jgi:hypothetical protein
VVTLSTRIRDVLGSNLVQGPGYLKILRGVPQSIQMNYGFVSQLDLDRFLSNLSNLCHPTMG